MFTEQFYAAPVSVWKRMTDGSLITLGAWLALITGIGLIFVLWPRPQPDYLTPGALAAFGDCTKVGMVAPLDTWHDFLCTTPRGSTHVWVSPDGTSYSVQP